MKKQKISLSLRKQKISSLDSKNTKGGFVTTDFIVTIQADCQITRQVDCLQYSKITQCAQFTCTLRSITPECLASKAGLC